MKKALAILALVLLLAPALFANGESEAKGPTVVYWSMWSEGEPQAIVIEQAIEKFEDETGINVQLEFKGRNGIREGLEPALEAGQNIDLFDEAIDRVSVTWGKYLANLEELAADYIPDHASKGLVAAGRSLHASGELHVIPYQGTTWGWWYNKDLFAKAGITSTPTTWAEFEAVCEKLVKAGITPITMDDAYATANMGWHLSRYVGEAGVNELVNNKDAWDNPLVIQAIEEFEEFATKGYFSKSIATNVFPGGQNTEFGMNEVALNANGAWLPNEIKGIVAPDFNWGYFAYPVVEGGVEPITTNYLGCQAFAVNKNSQVKEEAVALAIAIATGENDLAMSESALTIPADLQNTEWPKQLAELRVAFNNTTVGSNWAAGLENNPDLTPVIKDNTIKLMSGQITAKQFLDTVKAGF